MSLEKQAINESLLQSYRSIFISSQSIFLALGGLILNKSNILTLALTAICLIQIWWIWFRVVYSRGKIVDFYKYEIKGKYDTEGNELTSNSNKEPVSEYIYVNFSSVRKSINTKLGIKTFRATRLKLDIVLPIIFSAMWIGIAIFEYLD